MSSYHFFGVEDSSEVNSSSTCLLKISRPSRRLLLKCYDKRITRMPGPPKLQVLQSYKESLQVASVCTVRSARNSVLCKLAARAFYTRKLQDNGASQEYKIALNLLSGFHHTRLLNYFSVELLNLFQKFLKWRPKSFAFFRRGMRQSDSGRDDYVSLSYLETHFTIQRRTQQHHRKSVRAHIQNKSTSPSKPNHFILQLYQIYYFFAWQKRTLK